MNDETKQLKKLWKRVYSLYRLKMSLVSAKQTAPYAWGGVFKHMIDQKLIETNAELLVIHSIRFVGRNSMLAKAIAVRDNKRRYDLYEDGGWIDHHMTDWIDGSTYDKFYDYQRGIEERVHGELFPF